MTTKIATASRSVTDQVRATVYNNTKSVIEAAMTGGTNILGRSCWTATYATPPAIFHISEKSAEAQRQIERVKSLSQICEGDGDTLNKCFVSISSTVSLINAFLTSPIPIPVAGSGEDGEASLFLGDEDFYGDLEISGNVVEYYIKSSSGDKRVELFDSEKIEDGFIPPKLLSHLFLHYAQK